MTVAFNNVGILGKPQRLRVALCVLALAAGLGASEARACGFHDAAAVNLGMLNLAFPEALHVRTAVWMAQHDALIPREHRATHDPSSAEFRLEAMRRYRDAVAGLDALRERMTPMNGTPGFAVVLIGSLLWTRFEPVDGRLRMTPHANGPLPDDVVVVTDAPVVRALLDGTLTPADAYARGLVRLYGAPRPRAGVVSLLDRLQPAPRADSADGVRSAIGFAPTAPTARHGSMHPAPAVARRPA